MLGCGGWNDATGVSGTSWGHRQGAGIGAEPEWMSLLVPPRLVMMHPRHGYHTPWGEGFAPWQREVKHFLLDNARMYLRDCRVDCLRFDAVHAIQSDAVSFIVQTLWREF